MLGETSKRCATSARNSESKSAAKTAKISVSIGKPATSASLNNSLLRSTSCKGSNSALFVFAT